MVTNTLYQQALAASTDLFIACWLQAMTSQTINLLLCGNDTWFFGVGIPASEMQTVFLLIRNSIL